MLPRHYNLIVQEFALRCLAGAVLLGPWLPAHSYAQPVASVGVVASVLFGSAAVSDITDEELEPMIRTIARAVLRAR